MPPNSKRDADTVVPSGESAVLRSRVTSLAPPQRVVAITGASSFLGRNLVGILEEDPRVFRVVALDLKPPSTGGTKTRFYDVDLTSPASEERLAEILAAEQAETLVHLAFLESAVHGVAWGHELESVGTMHVLNAAQEIKLRKLILWSQTILYGARPSNPSRMAEERALAADDGEPFFGDKIAAERAVNAFAAKSKGTHVTILRTAPIVGPTVQNYVTRFLARRLVVTLMGFDPLWQFVHEVDALVAFKLAIDRDVPGIFNIAGEGVLPLSTIVKLTTRSRLPIPHPVAESIVGSLWAARISPIPSSFLSYLRYGCVADGTAAARKLGFEPVYTTRDALLDFMSAQRLRDAKLYQEPMHESVA